MIAMSYLIAGAVEVKEVVVERKDLKLSRSSNIAMWVGLAQIRLGFTTIIMT